MRLKTCPACGLSFDTWHPLQIWSRAICPMSADALTHYEEHNNAAALMLAANTKD